METTLNFSNNNWIGKLLILIIIAILGIIVFSVCQHAIDKHGEQLASSVDLCLSQKGKQWGTWQRKSDGHLAYPCLTDDGKWGIKIDKCTGENCTSMPKDRMKLGWQIIKYLTNTGYEPLDDLAKAFAEKNPLPYIPPEDYY